MNEELTTELVQLIKENLQSEHFAEMLARKVVYRHSHELLEELRGAWSIQISDKVKELLDKHLADLEARGDLKRRITRIVAQELKSETISALIKEVSTNRAQGTRNN